MWARLRVAGIRSSKARVLRLMRQAQLLAPQRQAVPVVEKTHSGTITTDRPNRMWGIDATATVTLDTAAPPPKDFRLRHDHGSQFMSDDFQNELTFLGIESIAGVCSRTEGNGCIERFFRTLKEQLLWVRHFQSMPELGSGSGSISRSLQPALVD